MSTQTGTPVPTCIALDPAMRTGWAVGGAEIASGVLDLSKYYDDGRRASVFHGWLSDMIVEHRPSTLVIERPFMRHFDPNTARISGIVFVAHMIAYVHEIPRREVAVSTYRKALFGNGRMKRAEGKAAALAYARSMGIDPKTDDEAEAVAMAVWWRDHGSVAEATTDDA